MADLSLHVENTWILKSLRVNTSVNSLGYQQMWIASDYLQMYILKTILHMIEMPHSTLTYLQQRMESKERKSWSEGGQQVCERESKAKPEDSQNQFLN